MARFAVIILHASILRGDSVIIYPDGVCGWIILAQMAFVKRDGSQSQGNRIKSLWARIGAVCGGKLHFRHTLAGDFTAILAFRVRRMLQFRLSGPLFHSAVPIIVNPRVLMRLPCSQSTMISSGSGITSRRCGPSAPAISSALPDEIRNRFVTLMNTPGPIGRKGAWFRHTRRAQQAAECAGCNPNVVRMLALTVKPPLAYGPVRLATYACWAGQVGSSLRVQHLYENSFKVVTLIDQRSYNLCEVVPVDE